MDTCLDGAPSALSNGNHTPQAYCAPDKMTAFSRLSRLGMTYAPLTESRGEALCKSYRAVFRARTLVQQGGGLASPEPDQDSGEKWRGSFVKYDPDSVSWRTHQCSLLGDLEPFSQTWPQWGLMRGGECWEQQTLAHHISGTEFGSSVWIGTPTATMSERSEKFAEGRMSTPAEFVKNWPTPTVCGNYNRKGASPTSGDGLATAVQKWPTPTSHNAKETNAPSEALRNEPTLASRVGGSLNPTWVEWLMGWPLGWTDLKPLATDKSPSVPQPHGNYLQEE